MVYLPTMTKYNVNNTETTHTFVQPQKERTFFLIQKLAINISFAVVLSLVILPLLLIKILVLNDE